MRFIHTSDWHLGQTLHNFDRSYEHQAFLDWLMACLVAEQADALLISGDIFDTANPAAQAQKQFYRFLQRTKQQLPHLNIIIIAGNHDSPGRLEAPAPLLEEMNVAVIGFVPRLADGSIALERLVLPLKNAAGVTMAWCLAIPFLRPGDVPKCGAGAGGGGGGGGDGSDGSEVKDPYLQGIILLYQQCLQYALQLRQPEQAIIALGHCHMVGGQISEQSERRIVIGGTEALSASMFDANVAYAALGHLHLAQRVGKQDHLRYCGSPLPLSFAEVDYQHQVLCVDLVQDKVATIRPILVPRAVQLLRIPKQPAPLAQVLAALAALQVPADTPPERQPYLEVRVRLDAPEPGLRAAIEHAIEGKPLRLAKIDTRFAAQTNSAAETVVLAELENLQPDDIFERLYQQKYQTDPPAPLRSAFTELMLANETSAEVSA